MLIGKNKLDLYPSLNEEFLQNVSNALCPFEVELPRFIETQINKVCEEFLLFKKETNTAPWEDSVLNSLDFHYSNEKLKIIEANTNASGFLLSNLLLKESEKSSFFESTLFTSFKKVFKDDEFSHVFINDENPITERMYPEFLMFKDFFSKHSIKAEIIKTKDIRVNDQKICLYNRDTDFYLEKNLVLKALWEKKVAFLSTTPHSYQNIADKKYSNLDPELLNKEQFSNLKNATLKTLKITDSNKEDIWEKKKHFFFKPSSSFGSKGVYAGKSVSRKKFETFKEGYLAQELHLPGKITKGDDEWKFDIRAYFSEGPVQKIIARVYKGQLTNFSTPGGGFALIKWLD